MPKFSVTIILHRQARQSEHPNLSSKRPSRPFKLNIQAQRAIIGHIEKFPYDNLNALSTLFKSY